MPKPNRGRTETIKDRAVCVYLPSLEMAEGWRRRAERAGISIPKFVVDGLRIPSGVRRARKATSAAPGSLSACEVLRRAKEAPRGEQASEEACGEPGQRA